MDDLAQYLASLDPEVVDWIKMTPNQRWNETMKLWDYYLSIGGSLEPEPDFQSPFFDPEAWSKKPGNGWPSLRIVRQF